VSGPAPITTKVTLCAICQAELPFKALKCPSCGAPRTELNRPPAPIVSALQAAAAVDAPPTAPASPAVGTSAGFRFGVGFALGALVIAALAWLAFNALQGTGGGISLGSPIVSTFSGSGSATSEVVHLSGEIDVDWTTRPIGPAACRIRAVLQVALKPTELQVLVDGEIITEATGTQATGRLIDNDYLIDVDSTCGWTFRLKPRS